MFSSIDTEGDYYILLNLPQSELEMQAEESEYMMLHSEKHIKFRYLKVFKHYYEPFRSKD
jgi:hypothetical protein